MVKKKFKDNNFVVEVASSEIYLSVKISQSIVTVFSITLHTYYCTTSICCLVFVIFLFL